ncbi:hypothetical protein PAECIP111893_01831 [Paenibacillus plantiphilus]|uniref:Uncharacterized protein n=1 Tax=Paenibacillus plantiphilus TaxID=2905650 RepID=A0ABN8G8C4_9BACL|nr:hypothetical protein [Paenibacillus plantiphilus]CAH1202556.1 hypothetical protein PAECIP111893_01831 [Paenibacillus plantiphilus]
MEKTSPYKKLKVIYLLLFALLLFIDAALILMSNNNYYIIPLESGGYFYLSVVNITFIFLLIFLLRIPRQLIFMGAVILIAPLMFAVGAAYFYFELAQSDYEFMDSPNKQETLIVKSRVASLRGDHMYSFYKRVDSLGLLMRRIEGQDFKIMTSYDEELAPNEIGEPIWLNESTVKFNTKDGEKIVELQ